MDNFGEGGETLEDKVDKDRFKAVEYGEDLIKAFELGRAKGHEEMLSECIRILRHGFFFHSARYLEEEGAP